MQETEGEKNNMAKIKDARNRVQKYQTGGEVDGIPGTGSADFPKIGRYGRLTGSPDLYGQAKNVSDSIRQRNYGRGWADQRFGPGTRSGSGGGGGDIALSTSATGFEEAGDYVPQDRELPSPFTEAQILDILNSATGFKKGGKVNKKKGKK